MQIVLFEFFAWCYGQIMLEFQKNSSALKNIASYFKSLHDLKLSLGVLPLHNFPSFGLRFLVFSDSAPSGLLSFLWIVPLSSPSCFWPPNFSWYAYHIFRFDQNCPMFVLQSGCYKRTNSKGETHISPLLGMIFNHFEQTAQAKSD